MAHYTRKQWGASPSRGGTALLASRVQGIALHWPAMSKPLRGFDAVADALRGWQNYHQHGRGWSDVAYQVAIDQDGNTYDLRGLRTQSAANGDSHVNERYGALLLILAPGEKPTPAMVDAVQGQIASFRASFPKARQIVGHAQIRPEPTACPGPIALDYIKRGLFEPRKAPPKPTQGEAVDHARADLRKAKAEPGSRRARLLRQARQALKKIGYIGGNQK